MKMYFFHRISLLIFLSIFLPLPANAQSLKASISNDAQQVSFAENVITIELARALSVSIRKEQEKCLLTCPETGALELAIGLIGVSRSDASSDALVNLLGLKLDGAGSEGLSDQICLRGEKLTTRLKRFKAKEIADRCRTTFVELQKRELANVVDVKVEQVCHSETEIKKTQEEWLNAIKSRLSCEQ
ncbi:Imm57 family immunity protein [Methyloglobulus sp.]|uniref:Imm57 family immunity protein n=1 Tax=Methyloglobulus sp. TaxID=2518622 RepID=UPI003989366D